MEAIYADQGRWRLQKLDYKKNIAKEARNNPRAFYKYVNANINRKSKVTDLKEDDKLISENEEKTEVLNQYFASVFTGEDTSCMAD